MRHFIGMVLVVLAGCDTPSAGYRDVAPTRISIGQSVFDVRVKGLRAEAVRRNTEWAPNRETTALRAILAIERVSGCTVAGLDGDQAMITARLDCGSGAPPPDRRPRYLDCDAYIDGDGYGDLQCHAS